MKKREIILCVGLFVAILFTLILPKEAQAKISTAGIKKCSPYGYTVVFINGILDSREKAQSNATALQLALDDRYEEEPITVELAYNAEHLGGAGDMIQSVSQILFNPVSNYDLHDLLRQLSGIDATEKLLLVGYSQGALYANSIYEFLVAHGEPANSVGLYAVATPSNYVAGGGRYINSQEDAVISLVRTIAEKIDAPLPLANNFNPRGEPDTYDLAKTHAFISYLTGARKRIVSEIYSELGQLKEWKPSASKKGNCIPLLEQAPIDLFQKTVFSLADPAAAQMRPAIVFTYEKIVTMVASTLSIMKTGYAAASSFFGIQRTEVAKAETDVSLSQDEKKDFGFVKKIYGSSIDKESYDELNSGQNVILPVEVAFKDEVLESEPQSTSFVVEESIAAGQYPETYSGGTGLPPPPAEKPKDSENTTPTVEDNSSPTTSPPSPETVSTSSQSSTTVTLENSPISDSFDAFNRLGWQTFGQNVKNFDFNDGEDGECFRKGCVVGMGGNVYDTLIPRMYMQTDSGIASGAYTFYAKAREGFRNPIPAVTICAAGYDSCTENGSAKGINFISMIPLDNSWHHYYVAWKPGDSFVQSCFMQDYHHFSDCVWVDTEFPAGTKFDGIALWSTNGWRADISPYANLWFDELKSP